MLRVPTGILRPQMLIRFAALLGYILLFSVSLDDRSQVSAFAVFHEDVDEAVLSINDTLQKLDNVWMFEIPENVDF